jgi:hypothetical protein
VGPVVRMGEAFAHVHSVVLSCSLSWCVRVSDVFPKPVPCGGGGGDPMHVIGMALVTEFPLPSLSLRSVPGMRETQDKGRSFTVA